VDDTDPIAGLGRSLDLDEDALRLVQSLSPQEVGQLSDHLAGARTRCAQSLDSTIEAIIAVVPRLIRGRVKRILVGR